MTFFSPRRFSVPPLSNPAPSPSPAPVPPLTCPPGRGSNAGVRLFTSEYLQSAACSLQLATRLSRLPLHGHKSPLSLGDSVDRIEGRFLSSLHLTQNRSSPTGMLRSLNHLPDEILHSILCYSHPRSCAALEQTSHRFENVTNEPLLWRHYCQLHYKSWDRRHGINRKLASPVSMVDWKALFILRYRIDHSATQLLDSILASQTGRIEKFRAVIDFGYDAKDTLLRHGHVEAGEDHLARRLASNVHSMVVSDR